VGTVPLPSLRVLDREAEEERKGALPSALPGRLMAPEESPACRDARATSPLLLRPLPPGEEVEERGLRARGQEPPLRRAAEAEAPPRAEKATVTAGEGERGAPL